MSDYEKILGRSIRGLRKDSGFKSVAAAISNGLKIKEKTLYAYEGGVIRPEPERLVELVRFFVDYARKHVQPDSAQAYGVLGATTAVIYWAAISYGFDQLLTVLKDLSMLSLLPHASFLKQLTYPE